MSELLFFPDFGEPRDISRNDFLEVTRVARKSLEESFSKLRKQEEYGG